MAIIHYASVYACVVAFVVAFPNGAPELACKNMVPGHLPTTTTGDNPFTFTIDATTYSPGQEITGTLSGPAGTQFRGFLIEVGKSSTKKEGEEGLGEFTVVGSEQKNVCNKAAITHVNKEEKTSVSFQWTAPSNLEGTIYFRATVVQQFFPSKYWLGAFSMPLTRA